MSHKSMHKNKLQIESLSLSDPEILDFEKFGVYIFAVCNVTDIRGIIVDEERTQKLKSLAREMMLFYNSNDLDVEKVSIGNYYAVFDDVWHRVECKDFDPQSLIATVYFIDRGDEDYFAIDTMQLLPSKFFELPAQAIRLSLNGLEVFHDCVVMQDFMEDILLEKEVCASVLDYDQCENGVPIFSVELILEQDKVGEVNVNKMLLDYIYESVADPRSSVVPDKVSQEAYVTCVSSKVFVKLKSLGSFYLKELMEPVIKTCSEMRHNKFQLDMNKFYITKNNIDNSYQRAQVLKIIDEVDVEVVFVDLGSTGIVQKENLILLDKLSKLLADYPPQAIEVRLHRISEEAFNEVMANYLQQLVQPMQVLYMKTVDLYKGIPVVQLSKRAENNYLLHINDELLIESSLSSNTDQNNSNSSSSSCLDFDFPLQAPDIPEEDDSTFDVFVSLAAHPDDMTLQPYCGHRRFEGLMRDLTSECELYYGPKLTPGQVQIGYCYAAKHDELNSWYRAYIYKVVTKTAFAVYACDYGEYKIVDLKNLQPLEPKFREMPYQAIKAKLFGIKPEYTENWTIEDSMRFSELFTTKSFVSIIRKRELNKSPFRHTVLTIELIDTSTEEDVDMADVFNDEKRIQQF